jgi:hypothetical protein
MFCGLVAQAQNDGSSKIERNVPLVVVDSFYSVFSAKDPVWFSKYQGKNNQELVYEAKFFLKTEISLKTQNSILCLSLLFVV